MHPAMSFQIKALKDAKMERVVNSSQIQKVETETTFALRVGERYVLFMDESAFADFPDASCFEVMARDGRIILEPLKRELPTLEEIRDKIAALGITEEEVAAEVRAERARRNCPHCR